MTRRRADSSAGGDLRIVALAGGVGGAKLVQGLAYLLPRSQLRIIVNTGDDFEHLGLTICPDVDTVMYTLAGVVNPRTGWGVDGETFHCLESIRRLGVAVRVAQTFMPGFEQRVDLAREVLGLASDTVL